MSASGLIIPALLVAALVLTVPYLLVVHLRRQRDYRETGWQLASALERERATSIREAQAAERSRIATEMHDTLGHEMTLIAVQAGALAIQQREDPELRLKLGDLREAAATATDRLHTIVGMLSTEPAGTLVPHDDDLEGLVRRAQDSGMIVDATLDRAQPLDPLAGHAFHRLIEEGLTNAARHAPGATVEINLSQSEDGSTLRVTDDGGKAGSGTEPARPGSRRGLVGLTERFRVLGGSFDAGPSEAGFVLTGSLPHHPAVAATPVESTQTVESTSARDEARDRQRRSLRRVVLVPAGLILAAAVVTAGFFVFNTIASVLPPDRFAAISVGMPESEAERLLPPVQMIDPPTAVRPTGTCRFYEAEVSFFDRRDVYQICFADGRVVSTRTIEAGR